MARLPRNHLILALLAATALGAAAPGSIAFAQAPAAAAAVAAPWEKDAQSFVSTLIDELSSAVSAKNLAADAREAKLRDILAHAMAVERIGGFLLGDNKAAASAEQLSAYNKLIPGYVASKFADRIDDLVEQKLSVGEGKLRNPKEAIVKTSFLRKRDQTNVAVDWRLTKSAAGKIELLDVYVNGVSPLVTERDDFSAIVKASGFNGLLERLKTRAK